jgi:GTP-binding protein
VLADDERVIASELAGTTRDSVDVRFTYEGRTFVAIDTAGVRKKHSLQHSVEFFSQSRAFRAVRRASVIVLMLDPLDTVSQMDRKLVDLALKTHKPVIIAVNKWDLTNNVDPDDYREYLHRMLGQVDFAPIVFMSVKNRENVFDVVKLARELHRQSGERVGTGELNRVINAAFDRHHPQPRQNRLGRIYYSTQVSTYPPQIVVFVNEPELFPDNWRSYLRHRLHETTVFKDIPVKLKFKARERVDLSARDG